MPIRTRIHVPLTEEFAESNFDRFTTSISQTTPQDMGNMGTDIFPWGLKTQRHLDIRTFNPTGAKRPEGWINSTGTAFTTGPRTYLNNWDALVSTVAGVTAFTSITGQLNLTSLGNDASIILTMPNCPATFIDTSQSFLDLSTNDFQSYSTVSFAQSSTSLVDGDSVLTWPIAMFTDIDLSNISGVRIRLATTSAVTIILAALRLIGSSWIPSNVDIDTWNGSLVQTIPPNGQRNVSVPNNQSIPSLWYTAPTSGVDDPQPINLTLGIVFNTGSMEFTNSFSFFLRGVGGSNISQLSLQGLTQAKLTGPQPALSTSVELPRQVSDLQGASMKSLTGLGVLDLSERQANITSSWIAFNLTWGTFSAASILTSVTGEGYSWSGPSASAIAGLSTNTYYLCLVSIEDTTAQMQILNLDQTNLAIKNPPVFDTEPIRDSYLFPRRPGRVGWRANLYDGDAQIKSIRPQAQTYAEYRSAPFNSNTPVKGARLYTQFGPRESLWSAWSPLADIRGIQPLLSVDHNHFDTRHFDSQSTRVDVLTASSIAPAQGLISNVLTPPDDPLSGIIDWSHVSLGLSLWMPSEALSAGPTLSVSLLSEDGYSVPLTLPGLSPDQWQDISLYLPEPPPGISSMLPSGRYQLAIRYSGPPTIFWVDNVEVCERTTSWSARSDPANPWVDFQELLSRDDAGVILHPGRSLQVRGLAHRQNEAILSPPRIGPQYAQLGHLAWPENVVTDPLTIFPSLQVSSSPAHGAPVTFNASSSIAIDNQTNLISDPSFESGTTNWAPVGGNTITQVTTPTHSGSHSLQCTLQNSLILTTSNFPAGIVENSIHTIFTWLYLPSTWNGGMLQLYNPILTTGIPGGTNSVQTTSQSIFNQWQPIWSIHYYTTVGSYNAMMALQTLSTSSAGRSVYIDDVNFVGYDGRANVSRYHWDFGDGTTGSGPVVNHTYVSSGTYTVSLILTDIYGSTKTTSTSVAVS